MLNKYKKFNIIVMSIDLDLFMVDNSQPVYRSRESRNRTRSHSKPVPAKREERGHEKVIPSCPARRDVPSTKRSNFRAPRNI